MPRARLELLRIHFRGTLLRPLAQPCGARRIAAPILVRQETGRQVLVRHRPRAAVQAGGLEHLFASVRCGPDEEIKAGGIGERPKIPVSGEETSPAIDATLGD